MKKIPLPSVAEILNDEFMKPFGISAYKLAKDIDVPVSRIQDILHSRRRISVDTALRLSKYFGVSDNFFINIQSEIELRESKVRQKDKLDGIKPLAS